MKTSELTSMLPLNSDQKEIVDNLLHNFDDKQLIWLAGYLTGISLPQSLQQVSLAAPVNNRVQQADKPVDTPEITVLYGSRTGNGASLAEQLQGAAEDMGFRIHLQDMNEYSLHKLKDEKYLLVIVSTHGEGVPPIAAEEFYNFIHSKRAPKFTQTKFSVLALGDSSYVKFCQTGKDVDKRLEELGAERFYPRVDCDIDFAQVASEWIVGALGQLESLKHEVKTNGHAVHQPTVSEPLYSKQKPFKARLLDRIKLNGKGSDKETFHFELSLENSGLTYKPGDALGVYGVNSERVVHELIETLSFDINEEIDVAGFKTRLGEALTHNYELTLLTPDVVAKYNRFAKSDRLTEILADTDKLKDYIYGRDVVDLIKEFPAKITASDMPTVLRKLQPRLYSISSSLNAHPEEVHLTVSTVRYANSRYKEGSCSSYLSDRISDDDFINVFIEKNPEFGLPVNPDLPVIMIGPGTGVAPFRAFLEEREASGAKGKNWLFFGDRHFTTDFLYQTEFQAFHKRGLLTNLNVAFSRDADKKVYVQHKMMEHSRELFQWLEEGAHFYVCGDMKNMWNDVNKTLLDIIAKEGGLSLEKAEEYLKNLKRAKRYQVDVY